MAGFLPMWSPINSNIGDGSNLWDTAIKSQARASDMLNAAVDTIRTNQQNSANAALLQAYQKALADGATPDEARASAAAAANPFVTADTLSNMFQNSRYDIYSNIQKAQEDRTAKDWQGQNEAARQSNLVNTMYLKRDQKGYNQALDNANSVLSDIALKYFKAPDLTTTLLNDEQTKAQADNARASAENSRAQAARTRAQAALDMSNLYEQKILDAYYAEKATLGLDREPDEEIRADKIARLNKKYEQAYPGFMQIANKHGRQDILANTATSVYNTNLATNITKDPTIRQNIKKDNEDLIQKQDEALNANKTYDEKIKFYKAQGLSNNEANFRASKETLISLAKQQGNVTLQENLQKAKDVNEVKEAWKKVLLRTVNPTKNSVLGIDTGTNSLKQSTLQTITPYRGISINDDGSLNVDKSINTSIAELTQTQLQNQNNIREFTKDLQGINNISEAMLDGDENVINKYAPLYDSYVTALDNKANNMIQDASMGSVNSRMVTTILNNTDKLNNVESLLELIKGDNVDPYSNFNGNKQDTIKYAKKAYTKLLNSKDDSGHPYTKSAIYGALYMALADPNNKPLGNNWINNIDKTQLETFANTFKKSAIIYGPQLKQIDSLKRKSQSIRYLQTGQKALRQGDAETYQDYVNKARRAYPR